LPETIEEKGYSVMIFAHTALVITLLILTFWRRDIYLYLISCPVLITFGLRWYDLYHYPAGFAMALAIMATGIYCMILAIINLVKR